MVPPLLWACSSCTCCGNGSSVGGSCRGEGRKRTNRDRSSGTSRKCSSQRYGAGGDERKGLGGCASQAGARVEVPARKRRLHGNPAARVRLQPQRELLDRRTGPILKANDKEEIEDIFAPQYLHNKFVGETFSLNYYGYRNETVQYRAIASYATKVERTCESGYKNTAVSGGRYILAAEANWFKNAFTRFFGIGNRSRDEDETTYTSREANIRLSAGLNLGQNFSVLWTERWRNVRVDDGVIPSLTQTKSRFPTLEGIDGAQIFGHRLTALYDSRDNLLTPVQGTFASAYFELAHNLIHDEPDRWFRVAIDARHLIPHASGRMVFVGRVLIDKVFSQGIPFYERPTLGGENTLRGFGLNRFVDDNLYLVNLEERIRIYEKRIFDNPIELEVAPFLDFGRVNNHFLSRLTKTQFNPGFGIRALSRPNVVGRLDVGYGKDGGNVFVGLDYPF